MWSNSYHFIKGEQEAKKYLENCSKIRVGMALNETKQVMGDYDRFNKSTRSEIWIEDNKGDSKPEFYLSYPSGFDLQLGQGFILIRIQ